MKLKPERVQPGFRVAANGTISQEKVTVPLWLPLLGWGGGRFERTPILS